MSHPRTNCILLLLGGQTIALFIVFIVLRNSQLSSPSPFRNPFTAWSELTLLVFLLIWCVTAIVTCQLRKYAHGAVVATTFVIVGLGAAFIASVLIRMFVFLYP